MRPLPTAEKRRRNRLSRFGLFAFASLFAFYASAAPVSLGDVESLARGVASSVQVSLASGAAISLAQAVSPAEVTVEAVAATNSEDTAFYVIGRGAAGGFVVMSADDRLDPVLVIAPTGSFDDTPGTPLYDMLSGDVAKRLEAAESAGAARSDGWAELLSGGSASQIAYSGVSSINDVRVEPLVQSKWSQSTVGDKNVYNYYTPNNYVCGCVATAGAQIMRYHRYPTTSVAQVTRTCYVDGTSTSKSTIGGVFDWSDMPLVPTSSIADEECEAIGHLCYDLGVAIYMGWASSGSGTGGYCLKDAFLDVFGYQNAIAYELYNSNVSATVIKNAFLANFDAGYPIEMAIEGPYGGHSIVGDGYGYSGSELYVHLNMGWGGSEDAWYNLPDIGTGYSYSIVYGAVYNIFPDGTGDLITGRVLDESGTPVAGASVQALNGAAVAGTAKTSASGVYALRVPGGKTYSVVASASGSETSTISVYLQASVSTSTSGRFFTLGTGTVGNSWGNDITLVTATDPVAPSAPSGVSASDGTSTALVRVTWSASSGATSYKVYRATSDSSSAATVLASGLTSLYYDDSTAEVGTTYFYWVKAVNSVGTSDFSAGDSGYRAYAVPDAPTGVAASDGTSTTGVTVTWTAVSGATSYSVYRGTSSATSSSSLLASELSATSYTDTAAVAGTTYYYWVKATNVGGTSGFSAGDSGYRAVAAPSAPTGVSAADGLSASEISVSWTAVSGATSYSVYRGTSSASSSSSLLSSGIAATAYSDTTAVAGTTYYYWVKAVNAGGASAFSAADTGYLAVIVGPASVSASDGTYSGYIRVSWSASENATSYEVFRGTANAYSLAAKIAAPTATSFDDATATPGTLYHYWVRAVTSAGTSAFSAGDTGYRQIGTPTGVSATTGIATGVTVSWSVVTGASHYEIGRADEGAASPATTLGSATSLSFTDTTAVPGVTYGYFVRAVASAGAGAWSAEATGSRLIPTPDGLTASDGAYTDRVLVSWPALSGSTGYELMRADTDDIDAAETIATTTATSFSDTSAEYGLVYYYFLRAKFASGTSEWSASESGWRSFPAPTGVTASDGTSTLRITVGWDEIDGATLYQVWRYSDDCGRNELIGTSTSTSYNDTKNLETGRKYTYRVKAVFATGTGAFSESDTGYLKSSSPAVTASDGTSTSQISLTWSAASGAIAYTVYRATSSSSSKASAIASTSMLYYNDTSAAKGTLYYYWVRISTAVDTSDFGASDSGYVGLPAVSRVSATDGAYADKVVVSWSAVSGATSYDVYRATSDDSSAATRVKKGVTGLSWEDTDVTPGAMNWYWVRACDAGAGLWGASDSGYRVLASPATVTATTNQTDGVKVSWKATTSGVSFEIMRGLSDDRESASVIATVSGSASYTDNSAVPGYVYHYWVRAYSELSESDWSDSASGYRAVSAPATVVASDGTSLETVTVTWTAATSAKRYEIWRSTTTSSTAAEMLGETNRLVWVDATAEPGKAYYYWIKSVSVLDTSAFSGRDLGYVSTPAPTGVSASDGDGTNFVRVAWTAASNAVAYAVWRAESDDVAASAQIKTGVTALTYDDTSITPGKYYWYWVRPVSGAGAGVYAGPDRGHASLTRPNGLAATTNSNSRVTVSWKKTNGAESYDLYRAETNVIDFATNEVFATVSSLSYADTNAVPAVRYYYWLRANAEADISPIAGPADGFRLLTAPLGVSASDGVSDAFVKVTWNESVGAESYEVWRAENTTSSSAAIFVAGVTNELEYIDEAVTPGVSYTYWLKAISELSVTGFSSSDKGWRSLVAPGTVSASDGTSSAAVEIEWVAVEGATKYEIWRKLGDEGTTNGASRVATTSDGATTAYSDTGAAAGQLYWYWVRSVGAAGTGVFGACDSGFRAIAVPTNVKAADGSSTDYVRVTWSSVSGAESYEVMRTTTNALYSAVTNSFPVTGTTTFDDTGAVPGVIYAYSVRSVSTLSTSEYSAADEGYRKLAKIPDVAASDGTRTDGVEISWSAVAGAERYRVWRSTSSSLSTASVIAEVAATTYLDTGAAAEIVYYYWVNALADIEGEMGSLNSGYRAKSSEGSIDLGGGISWPLADNGDGTVTTNAIAFTQVEGGRLRFSGVEGEVGASSSVKALVKTALESSAVYTASAALKIVAEGTAELDLSGVWGSRISLFVIGVTTVDGEAFPGD